MSQRRPHTGPVSARQLRPRLEVIPATDQISQFLAQAGGTDGGEGAVALAGGDISLDPGGPGGAIMGGGVGMNTVRRGAGDGVAVGSGVTGMGGSRVMSAGRLRLNGPGARQGQGAGGEDREGAGQEGHGRGLPTAVRVAGKNRMEVSVSATAGNRNPSPLPLAPDGRATLPVAAFAPSTTLRAVPLPLWGRNG